VRSSSHSIPALRAHGHDNRNNPRAVRLARWRRRAGAARWWPARSTAATRLRVALTLEFSSENARGWVGGVYGAGFKTRAAKLPDAARALGPVAGRFAGTLFALGFIGSGLLAIPILAQSGFGEVSFANTGAAAAQPAFLRGLALLGLLAPPASAGSGAPATWNVPASPPIPAPMPNASSL